MSARASKCRNQIIFICCVVTWMSLTFKMVLYFTDTFHINNIISYKYTNTSNLMLTQEIIRLKHENQALMAKINGTSDNIMLNIDISLDDEQKVFSQQGEDGIILSIFNQIGVENKYFVEFGTQDASESNTRLLRERYNWSGLLMDGGYENIKIGLHKEFIYHSNVVDLFKKYNVPKKFDLLSTDTDFKDFWISQSILAAQYKPTVIISEVNSCFDPNLAITIPQNITQSFWRGSYYFGASPMAFYILYKSFGYLLIYCEQKGINCFWIHYDYLSEKDRKTFNDKQNTLNLMQCANYHHRANNNGCHPTSLSHHNWWQQIIPSKNNKGFSIQTLNITNFELDQRRCRHTKTNHI